MTPAQEALFQAAMIMLEEMVAKYPQTAKIAEFRREMRAINWSADAHPRRMKPT